MAKKTGRFEGKLDELFVRNAPHLPRRLRKALVAWMPIISLGIGVLALLGAMGLWRWVQTPDKFAGACNAYSVSGCGNLSMSRFSTWFWVALVSLTLSGVLYLLAYPGLWSDKKEGWKYVYYGVLLNLIYALASLFTGTGRFLHFLGGFMASFIGLYLLFQIRASYAVKRRASEPAPNLQEQQPAMLPYSFKKPGKQQ